MSFFKKDKLNAYKQGKFDIRKKQCIDFVDADVMAILAKIIESNLQLS